MRLVDVDKIQPKYQDMEDLGQEGFYFYDVEDINNAEPVNLANILDNFKRELLEILDSYSSPRFIDSAEMDVDKFKEAMSKARLQVHPIEKQAAIYHGCYDCEYQPEPLMACDWLHHQTTIFTQCPRWKARIMPPKQCE